MKAVMLGWVLVVLIILPTVSAAPIKDKYLEKRKWTITHSEHYEILSDTKPKYILKISEQLERYRAFCELLLNIPSSQGSKDKVKIIMTNSRKTWKAMGLSSDYISVFARDRKGQTRVIADIDKFVGSALRKPSSGRATVLQALTFDMFRDIGVDNDYPLWYRRGFSHYLASYFEPKNKIILGNLDSMSNRLTTLIKAGTLSKIRTKTLLTTKQFANPLTGKTMSRNQRVHFGAAAFALVHYFNADKERRQKLAAYLALVANGTNEEKALMLTTGFTFDELDSNLFRYLRSQMYVRVFDREEVEAMMNLPAETSYINKKITSDEFWQVFYPHLLALSDRRIPRSDLKVLYDKIKPRLQPPGTD